MIYSEHVPRVNFRITSLMEKTVQSTSSTQHNIILNIDEYGHFIVRDEYTTNQRLLNLELGPLLLKVSNTLLEIGREDTT